MSASNPFPSRACAGCVEGLVLSLFLSTIDGWIPQVGRGFILASRVVAVEHQGARRPFPGRGKLGAVGASSGRPRGLRSGTVQG